MPENIVPHLYQSITNLTAELYPHKICDLLSFIDEQFNSQCGIYSEGFRHILKQVLTTVVGQSIGVEAEDKAFLLLQRWKNMPPLSKLFEQPTSVLAASKDLTRMNCLRHKEIPADESWLPSIRANELTKRIGRHTTDILRNLEAANELFADLTKALGESVDSYAKSEADAAAAAEVEASRCVSCRMPGFHREDCLASAATDGVES